jgi:hypothetical protein
MQRSHFNLKRLAVIGAALTTSATYAQGTIAGNCDYPDQMIANEPYLFVLSTDSIEQRTTVIAVGDRKLTYDIVLSRKDTSLRSGHLTEHVAGTALWAGCFGGVTDDGVLHPDSWEYRSADGSMTITLFGEYLTHVQVTIAPIQTEPIPRVYYKDE